MKKIILNEHEYISSIIETGEWPEDLSTTLGITYLCRFYYYDNTNLTLKGITDLVIAQMSKYNFSVADYEEYKAISIIQSTYNKLKAGKLSPLRSISEIKLYKDELEKINNCENDKQRKVLFTIYVLAKLTNKYGWVYNPRNDIYKLANVSITHKKKENIIHELWQKELIKITNRVDDTKVGVDLIPEEDRDNERPVINITSLENLGNQYIAYSYANKVMCVKCGKIIRRKTTSGFSPKYCKACGEEVQREYQRISMRKLREKRKSEASKTEGND